MRQLKLTNTLTRTKELFKPIQEGHVGMYVCGPTVYGDAHLGHARPGVTYDVLSKLLKHLGYKVRYVRNITDVGHLEHDADSGEDKIAKKARLEQLPADLDSALEALKKDHGYLTKDGVFPEELIDNWVEAVKKDAREVNRTPHPMEFRLYYDL